MVWRKRGEGKRGRGERKIRRGKIIKFKRRNGTNLTIN
jgi:hypothetical protein